MLRVKADNLEIRATFGHFQLVRQKQPRKCITLQLFRKLQMVTLFYSTLCIKFHLMLFPVQMIRFNIFLEDHDIIARVKSEYVRHHLPTLTDQPSKIQNTLY